MDLVVHSVKWVGDMILSRVSGSHLLPLFKFLISICFFKYFKNKAVKVYNIGTV